MKSSTPIHDTDNAPVKSLHKFHIPDETAMFALGRKFATTLNLTTPIVIELVGDVGTGKTTFTRGLAAGLGVLAPVTSPSFTISKSYAFTSPAGTPCILTHYDFYRLNDPGIMADDLLEKYLPQNIVVVEWADQVQSILPDERTIIHFSYDDSSDTARTVEIKA